MGEHAIRHRSACEIYDPETGEYACGYRRSRDGGPE